MKQKLNVYICIGFTGHYPVGTASVVVASGSKIAAELLEKQLEKIGLPQQISSSEMVRVSMSRQSVEILLDGNY